MAILPDDQIRRLHTAILTALLTDNRRALLGGIDAVFVAGLPTAPDPGGQIFSDLHLLNAVERLADGTVPLKIWLENALTLAGQRVEVDVILAALEVTRSREATVQVRADHERHISAQPAASAGLALHQLRAPPADFTGREEELADLLEKMGTGGVTISGLQGQGGVGKTALALKLAHALARRYPDAQIDVDLKGVSPAPLSPATVMAHVIRAFQPAANVPETDAELAVLYRSLLHGKRALLLFDNARDKAQIEPLLPPPGCLVIITSRQRFTLSGLYARSLDQLEPRDAVSLLQKIAPRLDAGSTATIAHLCGYLPLSLRLSASALAERVDLEPEEYCEDLRSIQMRLDLVDASLSLSFDVLNARLQVLWCQLGVFPGDLGATRPRSSGLT
jgi:hypothetical protein